MFHADTIGLRTVLERIQRYAREQGERYWTPAPLIVALAARDSTFAAWQAARQPAA